MYIFFKKLTCINLANALNEVTVHRDSYKSSFSFPKWSGKMKAVAEYLLPIQNINSSVVSWKTVCLTKAIKRSSLIKQINKRIINLPLVEVNCTNFFVVTWIEFLKSVGYSGSTVIQKSKSHHPEFYTNGTISGLK